MFKKKRADTNLPLAVQLVIDQVETILKSPQISIPHKLAFLEMIENIGAITVNYNIEGNSLDNHLSRKRS